MTRWDDWSRASGPTVLRSLISAPAAFAFLPVAASRAQGPVVDSIRQARYTSVSAYPYVYYTPETEAAIGAGGTSPSTRRKPTPFSDPRRSRSRPTISTRKQYRVSLTPQAYFARNRWLVRAPLSFGLSVDKFLGFGAFAGIGDVAPALRDLSLGEFKHSLGFGLRFKFNRAEKVNLRADIGFGRGTNGVYFGLEEAF